MKSGRAAVSRVYQSSASSAAVPSKGGIIAASNSLHHPVIRLPALTTGKSDASEYVSSSSVGLQCEGCSVQLSRSQCSLCVGFALHTSHYCSDCERAASSFYADVYSSEGHRSRESWVQDDSGWWSWSHDRGSWGNK